MECGSLRGTVPVRETTHTTGISMSIPSPSSSSPSGPALEPAHAVWGDLQHTACHAVRCPHHRFRVHLVSCGLGVGLHNGRRKVKQPTPGWRVMFRLQVCWCPWTTGSAFAIYSVCRYAVRRCGQDTLMTNRPRHWKARQLSESLLGILFSSGPPSSPALIRNSLVWCPCRCRFRFAAYGVPGTRLCGIGPCLRSVTYPTPLLSLKLASAAHTKKKVVSPNGVEKVVNPYTGLGIGNICSGFWIGRTELHSGGICSGN